ncbi:MAG: FHIPEP family type III secretion protein, partial [Lentisphaeria bacterium]|nr:FHIPEP family type III secretion protein [Lentisphaeria bacterium]
LVSQIPALIISVASGILVTKARNKDNLGTHLARQLLRRQEPLYICSIILIVIAFMPGLPFLPFFIISVTISIMAYSVQVNPPDFMEDPDEVMSKALVPAGGPGEIMQSEAGSGPMSRIETVSPMMLEIGFSLVPLVDKSQGGDLVDRIGMIRKQIKDELGYMIPVVQIHDNIELTNNEYRIMVRGLERARGQVYTGSHLAINPGDITQGIEGVQVKDPAFGFDAVWVTADRIDAAENMGYTVVDAASVITTHVTKVVREHSADLLSRQDVSDMMEDIKQHNLAVVEELIPNLLSIGVVHRVLQLLLSEKVPIHDLPSILEVLSDYAEQSKEPAILCEFCRQAMKGHIVARNLGADGMLYALTLNPILEEEIKMSIKLSDLDERVVKIGYENDPKKKIRELDNIHEAWQEKIIDTVESICPDRIPAYDDWHESLASMIPTAGGILFRKTANASPDIFVMAGPTGVGKTTTLAKLAAKCVLGDSLNVGVLTIDTFRVAAVDQLREYVNLLGIEMQVAFSPDELSRHLEAFYDKDVVFIDTPGRSQFDQFGIQSIQDCIGEQKGLSVILNVPANIRKEEEAEIYRSYKILDPMAVVITKSDEAVCCDGLSYLFDFTGLPAIYITTGQRVPEDIAIATPGDVASLILGKNTVVEDVED